MLWCVSYSVENIKEKKLIIAHEAAWYAFGIALPLGAWLLNQTLNCTGHLAMTCLWHGIGINITSRITQVLNIFQLPHEQTVILFI